MCVCGSTADPFTWVSVALVGTQGQQQQHQHQHQEELQDGSGYNRTFRTMSNGDG